ncbi:3'-5' RNA exonuclease complex component [Diatrype stigma]|uniref:3'-5' RNA exonuclease complex component n=1 Tax=Diatrype stigma TaxID=117547 RepID=A0AAN9UXR7_9PEZI
MAQFDTSAPLFQGDELGELRGDDSLLKPGDLVELSSEGSRRPVLAVCLGRFNGYEHYYTSSAKWFYGLGLRTLFTIRGFASPDEIAPVIAELPDRAASLEDLNILQDLGHAPSREAGSKLLLKMLQFVQTSESIYQDHAGTLDASSSFIGDPKKHRYLTLYEIAEFLLDERLKDHNGVFAPAALYAVHRSLMLDEVFFRPLRTMGHRRSYIFEVSPLSEVEIIQEVDEMARVYLDTPPDERKGLSLSKFIETARKAIDESRKRRQWSQTGIIGPSTTEEPQLPEWSSTDIQILRFMELWAGYQKFPNYSRLQCSGSAILRAMDRYQDALQLSPAAGWTFLQEVSWIPPWEIPARYNVRFPDVELKRGGGFVRPAAATLEQHLTSDIFADARKDWEGVTAYCIDSEATMDIDDAVSLEKTSVPGQYWIHVHVADPASSFAAGTPVAKYAELIPETIYLPGHFERMLPSNISQEKFSLAPDKPCLTFSALVNEEGQVLENQITPGRMKEVVYMTGEDVAAAIGETRADPVPSSDKIAVGPEPQPSPAPPRKMTRSTDLTREQLAELTKLSELGQAIQTIRLQRGATPFFQPRPEAAVYFDQVTQSDQDNFVVTSGDPSIRVGYASRTATALVEHAMRLAGEVAARWCHDRGIPIPYRTQPLAAQNASLIQQYTRDVFYPLLEAGVRPGDAQWRHLRALLGGDEISTTAGPYFTLGVDMYTRATSPLRRFSDLIVHWQIEAAILHERRTGRSLLLDNKNEGQGIGKANTEAEANRKDEDDDSNSVAAVDADDSNNFLPFSLDRLNRMLPMLRMREQLTRTLTRRDGADQWILQALVRAWQFGEAALPETFRFEVVHVAGRRSIIGRLDWFERPALMRSDGLEGIARMVDVRIGDVFRVRLRDVNVHAKQIFVEAVERLESVDASVDAGPHGKQAEKGNVTAPVTEGVEAAAASAAATTI